MVAAWEIREANSILIGILHVDNTTIAWALGLRNLIIPGKEEHRRFYPFMPVSGMPYDHARNTVCRQALNYGAEWVGFLDSDVVPPRDAFVRLMSHKLPMVSGMYCRRSPPHSVPVMIRNGTWVVDFVPGSMVEVDVVGAGCLLIHRSLLEQIPPQRPEAGKHWFDWRVDMMGMPLPPDLPPLSEDFTLCHWARAKMGIKVFVDTGVVCRHVGYAQSTFGKFEPAEMFSVNG